MAKIQHMSNHLSFLRKYGQLKTLLWTIFLKFMHHRILLLIGLMESIIPSLVTSRDNSMLINAPSREEVRSVVFNMHGDRNSFFYYQNRTRVCYIFKIWVQFEFI